MSRKFASIILAVTTLISSLAIAYADEVSFKQRSYASAVAALSEEGMVPHAETALTDGRGTALAVELGMLQQRGRNKTMAQLGALALEERQAQRLEEHEAEQRRLRRTAYLALYSGMMITQDTVSVLDAPEGSELRTLKAGQVAKFVDLTDDGWYEITFGKTTGFIPAESCAGVDYADYEGQPVTRDLLEELIDYAYTWLGTPYVYGGSSYSGTDCSGFTMRCFEKIGIDLSHGCSSQYRRGTPVTTAQRDVGDLVFFDNYTSSLEHVGIYLGGGRFIHASSSKGLVVSSLYETYFAETYVGAVRILEQ